MAGCDLIDGSELYMIEISADFCWDLGIQREIATLLKWKKGEDYYFNSK